MTIISWVVFFFIVLYAYLIFQIQTAWSTQNTDSTLPEELPFVSIIIAARNEEDNISKCLDSLDQSDYPSERFEVIVIDDMSTDQTTQVVQSHSGKNIKLFNLKDATKQGSKKQALAYAAEVANGEIWMYTDADCIVSPKWISKCVSTFSQKEHIKVILGPVSHDGNLSNYISIWQQLDLMGMMAVTNAGVTRHQYYIGNGANLSIRANLWDAVGYAVDTPHRFASGDDVTLVQKAADRDKESVYYLLDQKYIVNTEVQPDFTSLLRQRLRWTSKNSLQSSTSQRVVMSSIFLLCFLTLIMGFLSLINWHYCFLFLFLMGSKALIDTIYLSKIQAFFKTKISWFWMIILSPIHTLYVAVFGLLAIIPQRYSWKGRFVN